MRILTAFDTIGWLHVVLLATSKWTSQISYEHEASLLHKQPFYTVLMCLYTIVAKHAKLLETAHAHFDDDRFDMVECGDSGHLKLDLSDQLRVCSIASADVIRLRCADELLYYRRRAYWATRSDSCVYWQHSI